MDGIIASYTVEVTIRGPEGTKPPTNKEVEEAVENGLTLSTDADVALMIRASSERTDK